MTPALELRGVSRAFGTVRANHDVSLSVAPGELHGLVGENGAGKSTAMRIAAGLLRPDAGDVRIFGQSLSPHSPSGAIALGMGMVHQRLLLAEPLSVVENVVLGREPTRCGQLDLRGAAREIAALGDQLAMPVDPWRRIEDLSVGERQRVEILKVLWRGARLLVLDEPTAVLAPGEARALLAALRGMCVEGRAVVLVAHRLDEVMAAADRVTVLRRGEVVSRMDTANTTAAAIASAMMGGDIEPPSPPLDTTVGDVALAVHDLRAGALSGASLEVRGGEIVGVAGVEGNGQRELAEAIAGVRPVEAGAVVLGGRDVTHASVRARRRAGLAFVPEDRAHALVSDFTLAENLLLGAVCEPASALAAFDVRPADESALTATLSGGNQQKLLLAREMSRPFAAIVASYPTRGADIAAVRQIHERLLRARAAGKAVLLMSADLDELRALCDRILVLFRGRVAGQVPVAEASDSRLGAWMTGAHGPP